MSEDIRVFIIKPIPRGRCDHQWIDLTKKVSSKRQRLVNLYSSTSSLIVSNSWRIKNACINYVIVPAPADLSLHIGMVVLQIRESSKTRVQSYNKPCSAAWKLLSPGYSRIKIPKWGSIQIEQKAGDIRR